VRRRGEKGGDNDNIDKTKKGDEKVHKLGPKMVNVSTSIIRYNFLLNMKNFSFDQ
jgi:hypothetical protein